MPIVVPIEWATVICVPCVKKLIAGIENNKARILLGTPHQTTSSSAFKSKNLWQVKIGMP